MPRKTPPAKRARKPVAPAPRKPRVWLKAIGHVLGIAILLGGLAFATIKARAYVADEVAAPTGPLSIVFKEKPVWMSDFLASQIAATIPRQSSSAFDHDLLVSVVDALHANPWVAEVKQVRRVFGQAPGDTLEVDATFRAPVALVKWGEYFWLVDGDGVKLPEQFTNSHVPRVVIGRDGKMNIRIIEGVESPPPEPGLRWHGSDLAAGLAMVKLLYERPSADQIVSVNVANFDGRVDPREAQLVLRTKFATEVRWGRPINATDFFAEVPVTQKLDDLDKVMAQYGRVDAGQPWIDLRFDRITYPKPDAAPTATADTH